MSTEVTQAAQPATPAAPIIPQRGTPEWDVHVAKIYDEHTGTPVVQSEEEKAAAAAAATPASGAQKPEGVPEKFWNAKTGVVDYAAWSKSTAELEKQLTQNRQQKQAPQPTEQDKHAAQVKEHATKKSTLEAAAAAVKAKPGATPDEIKAAEDAVKAHGEPPAAPVVDLGSTNKSFMDELGSHLQENNGKISEEMYAKAEKLGFDKATLDNFVAGQMALAEKRDTTVKSKAGVNEDLWGKMREWAGANMTMEERVALNASLASGSIETAALALQGLKSKYEAAAGSDPMLLGGNRNQPTGDVGFTSLDEQKAAQADPRYKKNATYRASVERRIALSNY
jgi:hypothetical protein